MKVDERAPPLHCVTKANIVAMTRVRAPVTVLEKAIRSEHIFIRAILPFNYRNCGNAQRILQEGPVA